MFNEAMHIDFNLIIQCDNEPFPKMIYVKLTFFKITSLTLLYSTPSFNFIISQTKQNGKGLVFLNNLK